ncbi:MAG: cytochrome c biogenesis heme-transporting ATPase CcmA [Acidobacteriota bacterium]
MSFKVMLEVINLGCVRGERRLFRGLNFSTRPGELIEIRGTNGSGKTSMLRILCGLTQPAEGEVRWDGKNIRSLGEEYFGVVAYVAHQNGVKDELTALENLLISSGVAGNSLNEKEAREILSRIGLRKETYLPSRFLSAGQRRRVALARLLATRAKLWILDEVLTSLDTSAIDLSCQFISEHLSSGGMAIVCHSSGCVAPPRISRLDLWCVSKPAKK